MTGLPAAFLHSRKYAYLSFRIVFLENFCIEIAGAELMHARAHLSKIEKGSRLHQTVQH